MLAALAGPAHARERHPERAQLFYPPVSGLEIGEHERIHDAPGDQAADVVTGIGLLGDDSTPYAGLGRPRPVPGGTAS